ncbi:TPA: TIGR03757 family integrating conjugative element protein [Pseudomonas aeruginosa]|uniref:TIGR03757 family integrating conjugative element protein n=1 Tax=Pseudomonas aeruginosa TaxID=287 RepID=UPI0003B9BA7A|nr:TIGR03757 family integrating conjugative element protein [Pseudomonas aeruginosa]EKT9493064.1 TIGR03757 family integrating conjugative element protein [Pseudomonas aeruginosa]ERY35584.1 integrating conjugative element protein [Pseudomonas aeruginosa BL13]MBH4028431.1 TIGR03757 family integrating conjugative element protein [Pseudomonas aeruginosa]MBV5530599.1 TIGR03757 family integrating conjugative element protein [Pseudomonas aeruginosa]MCS8095360.1 TIGR03757 family integrating conjugativ
MLNPFRTQSGPIHFPSVVASGLCVALALASQAANSAEVTVFTDRSVTLKSAENANVVRLDAAKEIEAGLAADLPANPHRAQTIVHKRLKQGGARLQRDLASAYQGVADAWGLSVSTVPAVVVDRRYVIYGEPDVPRAVARIEAYRRAQP